MYTTRVGAFEPNLGSMSKCAFNSGVVALLLRAQEGIARYLEENQTLLLRLASELNRPATGAGLFEKEKFSYDIKKT